MSKDPDGELFRGDVNLEAALELLGMREPIDTSFALPSFSFGTNWLRFWLFLLGVVFLQAWCLWQ